MRMEAQYKDHMFSLCLTSIIRQQLLSNSMVSLSQVHAHRHTHVHTSCSLCMMYVMATSAMLELCRNSSTNW